MGPLTRAWQRNFGIFPTVPQFIELFHIDKVFFFSIGPGCLCARTTVKGSRGWNISSQDTTSINCDLTARIPNDSWDSWSFPHTLPRWSWQQTMLCCLVVRIVVLLCIYPIKTSGWNDTEALLRLPLASSHTTCPVWNQKVLLQRGENRLELMIYGRWACRWRRGRE